MEIKMIGEFGLIARLTKGLGDGGRVVRGVGDDCAVLRPASERFLLATCDAQIEGVHFREASITGEQLGRRAAAVNLSDIAAMGGEPLFALLSLSAPESWDVSFLESLYAGFESSLAEFGARLVGGNTARLPERLHLDVTLLGEVEPAHLMLRSGARPGDLLCVTGNLGASAAGLAASLSSPDAVLSEATRRKVVSRHLVPTPRVREGRVLGATGSVTSCIDLSDGLMGDARHIAEESAVRVVIHAEKLPICRETQLVAASLGLDAAELALRGGEDFELLFTVSRSEARAVIERLERETGTRATAIGEIERGDAGIFVLQHGAALELGEGGRGFDHFGAGKK